MPPSDPREEPLGGLLRKASPDGDLMARQALGKLQARLFGRSRETVQIGRYVLEERIGAGSGGMVHRAFDPKHERKVALKLLRASEGRGYEAARARLLREAQALGKLRHPNVVRIFDVGTYDPARLEPGHDGSAAPHGEGVYLAMELVEGSDLARWLAEERRGWETVRDVFVAAGRGLAAAHAQGIVHRDFKPANVSIDREGHVRVLDFGLARPLATDDPDPSMGMTAGAQQRLDALARPLDATLTAPGALLGTPAYMAPEQHERRHATPRSDQYAFCMALYEAWYEQRPFLAVTEQELRQLKQRGEVLPAPAHAEVPPHLFAVLQRGLSPRPEDRFDSMEALLQALTAPAPRRGWKRGRTWAAAGLVLAASVGGGAWALMHDDGGCDDAAWSRSWGRAQRLAVQQALAPDEPHAARTAASVTRQLDALAELGDSFEAQRCDGGEAEPAAVTACAAAQRERFERVVGAATRGDDTTLVRVAETLAHWPAPSSCSGASDDAAEIEREDAMVEARLRHAEGRLDEALPLARQAHALATARDDATARASAAGLLGHLALEHGALREAEAALTEALWSSDATTSHEASSQAAIDLLILARRSSPRPADAPLWTRLARERAAMPSVPAGLRLRLYLALAELALADGDPTRARESLRQGLALPADDASATWRHHTERALAQLER